MGFGFDVSAPDVYHFDDWGVTSADTTTVTPLADISSGPDLGLFGQLSQIGGAAVRAFGAYGAEDGRRASYRYSAESARANAEIANWQAAESLRRGEQTKVALGIKTGKLKGSQRASLAARGIDIGEGSALDILTSTDYMYQTDIATATTNAEQEAWGHRMRARNYQREAGYFEDAAEGTSPFAAAAGSLLTDAGRVASSWYRLSDSMN